MPKSSSLPMLTPNAQRLIQRLAHLPRIWVTTSVLAQAMGVSRRTVLRELAGAEAWLTAAGYHIQRSPGKGLLLDEDTEARARLLADLPAGQEQAVLSRRERRQLLLAALLAEDEPVKTYALAQELGLSEHALSTDLDGVEEWLRPFEIRLMRRPGVGIWLEGAPERRRRAAGTLLRLHLPEQDWQTVLRGEAPASTPLAALLDPAVTRPVWDVLLEFEKEEQLSFTDTGFLSLAVHITLTVRQMQNGIRDDVAFVCPQDTRQAEALARRLEQAFRLPFSRSEIGYLALYLDAYRTQPSADGPDARDLNARYLASLLIDSIEQDMKTDLSRYPSLGDDLCAHLRPMLHRLEQGAFTENPQLELIREQYAPLWRATRAACDRAQQQLSLPAIPDAEAGFLAMHFGAVLEQEALSRLRLKAMVVCPYGMASSRFLTAQLMRDFPVLHIQSSGSVRSLDAARLRADGIDLVISTVPIQLDHPHICVNPILREQDTAVLRDMIQRLQAAPAQPEDESPARDRRSRAEALRYAALLSAAILDLLDNIAVRPVLLPTTRGTLIREGARLFCPQTADARTVEQQLLRREKLGDTHVQPLQAVLLHCRTAAVEGCRLGYLQAQPPVYEDGRPLCGALVLLAPEEGGDIPLQVMQAVSALLIEEPALMDALRAGDRAAAAALLEKGLGERFREAMTLRLRGKS